MASIETCQFSTLGLKSLRIKVKLGCSSEERSVWQYVRFDVQIRFHSPPTGCITDQIGDTICYGELSDKIRMVCHKREFKLIESLSWEVFSSLKEGLPEKTQLWIKVNKEKPPIADLEGGATFCLGDWI